jgi:hypothetical protein
LGPWRQDDDANTPPSLHPALIETYSVGRTSPPISWIAQIKST